jgi:hypothetical protein
MRIYRLIACTTLVAVGLFGFVVSAQNTSVAPLNTVNIGVTLPGSLNATDSPAVNISALADTSPFKVGNVIKLDSEYFLITAVAPSMLTATRAQLGSIAAAHNGGTDILRVYQVNVMLSSPNVEIGAYQLQVSYDNSRLSIISANVFPGTGNLGTPIAINTNTPGLVIVNSFNATNSFTGGPTPVARLYFSGTANGSASVSVSLTDLSDKAGSDLDPITNSVGTTLNAPSLTVSVFDVVGKRVRGQITSQ